MLQVSVADKGRANLATKALNGSYKTGPTLPERFLFVFENRRQE
jgi:hypothetical protein